MRILFILWEKIISLCSKNISGKTMNEQEVLVLLENLDKLLYKAIKQMTFHADNDFLLVASLQAKITKLDNERAELSKLLTFLKEN